MRLRFCNCCAPQECWYEAAYLLIALLLVAAVTFPFDVQDHPHWTKVAWIPFVTGVVRPLDLLLNAALYFPVGFVLSIPSRRRRMATAARVALVVSLVLEFAQVWSHQRFPSMTDVVMNVIGSAAGAASARADVA